MASNNRTNRPARRARGGAQRQSRQPRQKQKQSARGQRQRTETPARRVQRASGPAGIGGNVLSTIRNNPIPAVMIGAGLTWMLLGERIGSMYDVGLLRRGRRRLGELGETFSESFGSAAEGTASTVRGGLMTIRDYAQEGLGTAGEAIRGGAGAVRRSTRRAVSLTADTLSEAWENYPLAVCAAALAAGFATGMLLPSTSREDRAMGRASDALADQARRAGASALKRGKRLAAEAVQIAGREARRQGLTAGDLSAKVKRVASRAREAIAPA